VKLEPLSLTAHQVGHGNRMHARKKGQELGSVYTQNEARCYKKSDVQVCTLTIMQCCPVTVNIRAIATYATFLQLATSISMHVKERDCNINGCLFFRRFLYLILAPLRTIIIITMILLLYITQLLCSFIINKTCRTMHSFSNVFSKCNFCITTTPFR
jgi:hypothetical protein